VKSRASDHGFTADRGTFFPEHAVVSKAADSPVNESQRHNKVLIVTPKGAKPVDIGAQQHESN
jgi:hypothetical protein